MGDGLLPNRAGDVERRHRDAIDRLTAERDRHRDNARYLMAALLRALRENAVLLNTAHSERDAARADADRLREALARVAEAVYPPPGEPTDGPVDVRSVRPAEVRCDDGTTVLRVPLREVFEIHDDHGEPTEDGAGCQNVGHWIGGEVGAPGGHDGGDGSEPCDTEATDD